MNKQADLIITRHDGDFNKVKSVRDGDPGFAIGDNEHPSKKLENNSFNALGTKIKVENGSLKCVSPENEVYRICQALILSFSVFLLCYYGLFNGRTEYSVLENGQIVRGYVHKAIITLSLGYSVPYAVFSLLATGMLIYSLISKNPRWSLPSIALYSADLVCDVSDAIVAVWLFFINFSPSTALFYACGTLVLITEVWLWLGVLRLYEYRTFK